MELIAYDDKAETMTVRMSVAEVADLHSVALGVLNTEQDYVVLGVREETLEKIREDLMRVLDVRKPKPA